MDFDLSKENIQPLRGGRNATQLGVALQAQSSTELQRELIQQKEMLENSIRTYEGDDPLENWYHYISWVEQSFPKHGHEGNLEKLLADCLSKFEHDKRYINDRRFCKLWIKFIDYKQNRLELYHMLYAKGICTGCADLYKAWAFYHEANGDYKNADMVFNIGISERAQPYEELVIARQNMVFAAGQQVIGGLDQARLAEQRQALTMLRTYKPGRVGSVRTATSSTPGVLPGRASVSKPNAPVPVFEDDSDQMMGAAAAPVSIVAIAKGDEAPKENIQKPGIWPSGPPHMRTASYHRPAQFFIHEDTYDIHSIGLQLPPNFFPVTHETFSELSPLICYMEPEDPTKIPKYPKSLVYSDPDTEYSIEEIKAQQYSKKMLRREEEISLKALGESQAQAMLETSHPQAMLAECLPQAMSPDLHSARAPDTTLHNFLPQQATHEQYGADQDFLRNNTLRESTAPNSMVDFPVAHQSQFSLSVLWTNDSVVEAAPSPPAPKANVTKFEIFEESNIGYQAHAQPKGSAMKTPFKILTDEDLAETGSRGGLDIATTAQPFDGARNVCTISTDEDTNSSYGDPPVPSDQFNATTNTQMFNFNLNKMQVSTPQKQGGDVISMETDPMRRQLFAENDKALSVIFEETKSNASSASSGSSGLKSTLLHSKKSVLSFPQEQSTYHYNLAQNLNVNSELRSSILGSFIDCTPPQTSPITEIPPVLSPPVVRPTMVTPLAHAPSDPFTVSLISSLLERIDFPGQHSYGFSKIFGVPKLGVKKNEFVTIGRDRYQVEKLLGKGTFGSVYKGFDCQTSRQVALKIQKPPNRWEYYICRELQARLENHPLKEQFMNVHKGYFSDQASILVSDFSPNGSLLDITNKLKQNTGRSMKESLCIYFCIEMLEMISAMHMAKIIHADIKPDNFLVQLVDDKVRLHLIDFGCSIDMAMFPADSTFHRKVTTEDFICCEMLDGRPWSYHTDLFCVAATAHVLLFDRYIQMQKKDGYWSITQRFNRYMNVDCWNLFFSNLLNQQNGPAKIDPLIATLRGVLNTNAAALSTDMRVLVNLLKGR